MSNDIEVLAYVRKVQTLIDGGWRFTFDASENSAIIGAQLGECQRMGVVGKLIFMPINEKQDSESNGKGNTRKSKF